MWFYDREAETAALKKYEALSAESAQMIVITGRRRIGKTTLIKRTFTEIPFLYFFVGKKSGEGISSLGYRPSSANDKKRTGFCARKP